MKPDAKSELWLRWWLAALVTAAGWFYFWTATSSGAGRGFQIVGLDYYNLQTDGFLEGQLSLKYAGDPGIAQLKDPYDPAQNAPYRVMDMSYYQGRYYIYFGPTPVLLLFAPWRLLAGVALPSHLAAVAFAAAGYGVALLLLARLRRRHFPELGTGAWVFAALVLGLASMAPALLRRPAVYEVAIACAYFLVMTAFWSLHRALTARRGGLAWLALASAAYGLAILARPTCLYGAAVLPAMVAWWARRSGGGWGRAALAALLPVGVIFAGLLLYNYLRFDNPLEFGQIYQLTGRDMGKVKAFSWSYLPFNAWMYLLMPAQHSVYFPFFLNALPPPMPAGYDGLDDLYGVLPNLPFVVFAAGMLAGSARVAGRELTFFSRLLAVWLVLVFGVFLFFSGATIRYYLDFMPVWLLLACLGTWTLARSCSHRAVRIAVWSGAGLAGAWSVLFAVMVSFQHAGLLRAVNPAAFARLAASANRIAKAADFGEASHYGPRRIELKFPSDRRGKFEPLLVSGAFPALDYLWVLYTDEHHLQIGYEHTNRSSVASQPIPLDYAQGHVLELDLGAFYPPAAHPYFHGEAAEAVRRTTTLQVRLDGVPYLDGTADFYDPVSARKVFGRNDATDTFGRRFTGEIKKIEVGPLPPAQDRTPQSGPVEMAVIFGQGAAGTREPLLATGETGRGDLFLVEYLDEHHVRFALDHWGVGLIASEPVEIAPGYIYRLNVELGSLFPATAAPRNRRLRVELDGRNVLERTAEFYPARAETLTFGENRIGGSSCGPQFTGKILSIRRGPAP